MDCPQHAVVFIDSFPLYYSSRYLCSKTTFWVVEFISTLTNFHSKIEDILPTCTQLWFPQFHIATSNPPFKDTVPLIRERKQVITLHPPAQENDT